MSEINYILMNKENLEEWKIQAKFRAI